MGDAGNFAWEPRPGVVVRRAWPGDARQLAPWLRAADKKEIRACSGRAPSVALVEGVKKSEISYAVVADGCCEAIFGVVRMTPDFGTLWLLGSPWIGKHPGIVWRGAKLFLPILSEGFETLGNLISAEQTTYIRFLKRLGFEFRGHEEFPQSFLLFIGDFSHV